MNIFIELLIALLKALSGHITASQRNKINDTIAEFDRRIAARLERRKQENDRVKEMTREEKNKYIVGKL